MKINLPNKLTLARIAAIPVFVVLLSFDMLWTQILSAVIFIAACITDALDGRIARKNNLVTDFGAFADPIADKLLVMSGFVMFVGQGRMPVWMCIVILAREFIVSGFRLVAAGKGKVISAGMLGKIKTNFQMVLIVMTILFIPMNGGEVTGIWEAARILTVIGLYLTCGITLWSGADYIIKNRSMISDIC